MTGIGTDGVNLHDATFDLYREAHGLIELTGDLITELQPGHAVPDPSREFTPARVTIRHVGIALREPPFAALPSGAWGAVHVFAPSVRHGEPEVARFANPHDLQFFVKQAGPLQETYVRMVLDLLSVEVTFGT